MRPRQFFSLVHEAALEWIDDGAMRMSAALAYYAILSLAPLLIIVISIAGLVFSKEAARGEIAQQIQTLAGARTAEAVQALVQSAGEQTAASAFATVVGIVFILFGASGVFGELKDALNLIWGVVIKPGRPVRTLIRDRFLSFAMVLGIGFLLLVSLVFSAAVAAVSAFMRSLLTLPAAVWRSVDFALSFCVVTLLFALMFKLLPNVRIRWRDVSIGAVGTAFLFTLGKFLIGFYLGTSTLASSYGAAGSVIVILLWVFFSSCILFFGAEFTKVYARKYGSGIVPDGRAVRLSEVLRVRYGLFSEADVEAAAKTRPRGE